MDPDSPNPTPLPTKFVELEECRLAFTDEGPADAPPILFVHGIPTNKYLWRNVVRALANEFRCLAPDLPGLGETDVRAEGFDYMPPAIAGVLIEFLDRLGLDKVALVMHDQGGAMAQWAAVENPGRFERIVILNCVCYDNWPVPEVARFIPMGRMAPLFHAFAASPLAPALANAPFGLRLGVHRKQSMTPEITRNYWEPLLKTKAKREQFRRFLIAGDGRFTVEAAKNFGRLTMPVRIAWAENDRFLPFSWAERLAADIPGAEAPPISIPNCGHFLQEDNPERVAGLIGEFFKQS